ncbi:MAG: outer membrane beta-barrel protein [Nitrospirota bacterium]|nr:MAG: outer membrane beta-barrel protein [Nitrospirota bacterium]
MFLFIALFVIYSLVVEVAHCNADLRAKTGEAGFSLGYMMIDEDLGSDDGFSGRLDLGYNVNEHVGIELSLLSTLDYDANVPNATFLSLSALLYPFSDRDFVPYLSLGVGGGNFNTDLVNNESKFTVNGGIGFRYFIDETYSVKIDFHDYYTVDGGEHNYGGTIGIMMAFDMLSPLPGEEEPTRFSEPLARYYDDEDEEERIKQEEVSGEVPVADAEEAVEKAGLIEDEVIATKETRPEVIREEETIEEISDQEMAVQETRPDITKDTVVIEDVEMTKDVPTVIAAPPAVLEDISGDKVHIIHEGAQLMIHFPAGTDDIVSESFDLLLQLISYASDRKVRSVDIVSYSFDSNVTAENVKLDSKREERIRDFILEHSDIPASKIQLADQDRGTYENFREAALSEPDNINRLYILISFGR